jgi:phosphatidyl-myo-inositol alpha-mannosyltransferase
MRIVQVCPYSWDSPGGVQVHVRRLTLQLLRRGHDALVLAPARSAPTDSFVRAVGRPFEIPFNGSNVPLCFSRQSSHRVAEALDRFSPDIVHVHEPFAPSTSMIAAWQARSPVVATYHAYAEHARLLTTVSPLLGAIAGRIDLHIAVSDAARCHAAHATSADFQMVPNGTDPEMFQNVEPAALPPGRKLLFLNRLDPRKGFRVLVRAFESLASQYPDLLLLVVGDGQEADVVQLLRREIRERVVMLGALPHDRVAPYFAAADVFLAPATGSESFGIVLLEAMAAGLPIVASDIPGYREVVRNGLEGILVQAGDDAALSRAIGRVLDNPSLSARLGAAGRARVQEFSWETIAARIETLYDVAAARRRQEVLAGHLEASPLSSLHSAAAPRE